MSFTVCAANRPTTFALIDGNNFFVSCERVFNPYLNHKPVIVLSGNDGCAIARSNEAKALNIAMSAALHTFSHLVKQHDIQLLSCNFELYSDLSTRMMKVLQTFTANIDISSIDEAFLDLSSIPNIDQENFAQTIHKTIFKCIGIPVTIGIAPTKTLTKIANRIAKKTQTSVKSIQTPHEIESALKQTDISAVWGIGRALAPKLKEIGLYTAFDLAQKDPRWARKMIGIMGERLVRELQGTSCIAFNADEDDKKSIQVTRSFGVKLTEFNDIAEAISLHATRLGEQLRAKKLITPTISVFCRTSPFGNSPYFKGIGVTGFDTPTNDTQLLIKGAIKALSQAYQLGHSFQSAGVHAMGLLQEGQVIQKILFTPSNDLSSKEKNKRSRSLNEAIDIINKRTGKDTVFWASSGINPKHVPHQGKRSNRYTTRWDELKIVI
ncbi:MAG: Y-family DNA polymerase [Candidatus Paracaedibacteraceae bacterium]|nr:Y-family DNA polymerase [Candidatus Paracaedibacteraceae bacterium]